MPQEIIIAPCTGAAVDVHKGQYVAVEDIDGGQVADFFAEALGQEEEFLSTGVTIDCNESLRLKVGDVLYTNRYRPMFEVVRDDVGEHDLLHPSCRTEMFDFFYRNGEGHPNCLDNLNRSLGRRYAILHPLNVFMHTRINVDGSIAVLAPLSRSGDQLVLRALMEVRVAVAACSVSESQCNAGRCTALRLLVGGGELI